MLLARRVRADEVDDRYPARRCGRPEVPADALGLLRLRRGQCHRARARGDGHEEGRQPVVELVEALHVIDDALVGPDRAHHEGRAHRLRDLDDACVSQRPVGGEGFPCRVVEERQRERERREGTAGIALRPSTQPADARVELHAHAEEHDVAFEGRQPEALGEQGEGRTLIAPFELRNSGRGACHLVLLFVGHAVGTVRGNRRPSTLT